MALGPRFRLLCVAAALVSLAAAARGDDDPGAQALGAYEVAPGCPGRALFLGVVRSYLDPAERLAAPPPLSVRIRPSGARFQGELRAGDGEVSRRVEAGTCADTALALAYILALSISPNAAPGRGPSAPSLSAAPAPSAAPSASSAAPLVSAAPPVSAAPQASSAPAVAAPPASSQAPSPPLPPTPVAAPPSTERASSMVWVGLGVTSRVAPSRAPVLSLGGERRWGAWRAGVGVAGASRQVEIDGGTAVFRELSVEPSGCWVGGERWRGGGCVGVRAGVLRVNPSSGVPGGQSATAAVLAPTALLRGEVGLGGPWWLGARAGLSAPVVRPGFGLIAPAREVFRVPSVVVEGGLALGLHFL